MLKEVSNSPQDTFNIAISLAKKAKPGDIFCLVGGLGVGKTHFVKGFAKGLGIEEDIDSPTFTIVKEYNIKDCKEEKKLYHFDVYRLENPLQLDDIGFDEYVYSNNIVIIEWADLIKDKIPKNAKWIYITNENNKRLIEEKKV